MSILFKSPPLAGGGWFWLYCWIRFDLRLSQGSACGASAHLGPAVDPEAADFAKLDRVGLAPDQSAAQAAESDLGVCIPIALVSSCWARVAWLYSTWVVRFFLENPSAKDFAEDLA